MDKDKSQELIMSVFSNGEQASKLLERVDILRSELKRISEVGGTFTKILAIEALEDDESRMI